jgi:hypothetical protein
VRKTTLLVHGISCSSRACLGKAFVHFKRFNYNRGLLQVWKQSEQQAGLPPTQANAQGATRRRAAGARTTSWCGALLGSC